MMRRLLGPVGGPILFILVTVSVFGVLGWVTHSALQVEEAQREAAARAELGSNLRVALWRLDGRMLPALGVEYSRPFYHYGPADPVNGYGFAATPLLSTDLPVWMKLHFQLDAANGWDSPQVLCKEVVERVRDAWGIPLQNVNDERRRVLGDLRSNYPVRAILDEFTSRDRAGSDAMSYGTPFLAGDTVSPPESNPTSPYQPGTETSPSTPSGSSELSAKQTSIAFPVPANSKRDSYHLFGIELCICNDKANANNLALNQLQTNPNDPQKKPDVANQTAPGPRQGQQPAVNAGRGRGPIPNDNIQSKADSVNRDAETKLRGIEDVRPPQGNYRFLENSTQNPSQMTNEMKMTGNGIPTGAANGAVSPLNGVNGIGQPTAQNPVKAGAGPAQVQTPITPSGPLGKVQPSSATSINPNEVPRADKESDISKFKNPVDTDGKRVSGFLAEAVKLSKSESDRNRKLAAEKLMNADLKKAQSDRPFFHRLRDALLNNPQILPTQDEPRTVLGSTSEELIRKDLAARRSAPVGGMPPSIAPPVGNVNPISNDPFAAANPGTGGPVPLVNHLGSMRPQWITGSDGTEKLVLVRVARVDNKDICQGIVLDWTTLESMLKDEVKDLFPDAKLVPVKDTADISQDRVMTSLPVQLDPGAQPEAQPAGLTALRLGLLLAWAAAIIAFGAVGFCGWTLIDLAERRIRFVSAVTHELRTPLTSLRLYLDLLVSGMIQDEAKKQEYLNTLTIESDRLHRLIDNVLDFARLEKRRKNGDKKPIAVAELIEQLRQTWADRLSQESRELVVISTLPVGHEVKTDAAMVQQILGNLVDNARKYSRDAVDRRIWIWAKPNGAKSVAIEIEDRGPGVPASERRSIFKPFRRGDQADRSTGGAGLGLALAKSWAEVLGGKLCYCPADGGTGACFRLELPVG